MQLPDTPGLIPWAALAAGDSSQACASSRPPLAYHAGPGPSDRPGQRATGRRRIPPLALIAPWFSDDGITLQYLRADLWLARGAAFKALATASMDRALGRDVRPWMPDPIQGAIIQRLQTELQMLLYTHVFNDLRAERGLPPINSFWVHGTGACQPARGDRPDRLCG
jgi:hypothetical protein